MPRYLINWIYTGHTKKIFLVIIYNLINIILFTFLRLISQIVWIILKILFCFQVYLSLTHG